jgi:formylmethanofuran dehydrogenase subunit E
MDEIFSQARCDNCGEFYHKEAMVGRYCIACSEESDEENGDYN